VQWPWKEQCPNLPENRELSLRRLRSSVARMKQKPELLQKYQSVIDDQLQKGVIEKVERNARDGRVHYIPHHAVITKHKSTTMLRVAYDASAKTKPDNLSLNECLFRGPVLLHDLCGMIIRFRMFPIAIVADIEKAFLQIGLHEDQRDVTRFLWIKTPNNPSVSPDNVQENRFARVAFGVISSPFLLGATINFHIDSCESEVADKIKSDIYVDNLITGCHTFDEACTLYSSAKEMFNDASMNLREWVSNNQDLTKTFQDTDRTQTEVMSVLGHT